MFNHIQGTTEVSFETGGYRSKKTRNPITIQVAPVIDGFRSVASLSLNWLAALLYRPNKEQRKAVYSSCQKSCQLRLLYCRKLIFGRNSEFQKEANETLAWGLRFHSIWGFYNKVGLTEDLFLENCFNEPPSVYFGPQKS